MLLNNEPIVNSGDQLPSIHWQDVAGQYLTIGLYPEMLSPAGYHRKMSIQRKDAKKGSHQRFEAIVIFDCDYAQEYLLRYLRKRLPDVADTDIASFLDKTVCMIAAQSPDQDQFFLENF